MRGDTIMEYISNEKRYEGMEYRKCGESGLKLPAVSLGLWHNFGDNADYENMCNMCFTAFDNGITHFDIANNTTTQSDDKNNRWINILYPQYNATIYCTYINTNKETLQQDSIL